MNGRWLVTGGSGLLGGELKQLLPAALFPSSAEFNVRAFEQMDAYLSRHPVTAVLHAAAFTSPPAVEKEPLNGIETNIIGTANVVKLCMKHSLRLIYISTDYVFSGDKGDYKENEPVHPVNKYAWSKLGGECAVRMYDKALIVRTSFGANVFPYDKAFVDQWTSRLPVKEAAKRLKALMDAEVYGVIHIGSHRRTVYEYARSLNGSHAIGQLSIGDVSFKVPRDTSLDCSRYDALTKKGTS